MVHENVWSNTTCQIGQKPQVTFNTKVHILVFGQWSNKKIETRDTQTHTHTHTQTHTQTHTHTHTHTHRHTHKTQSHTNKHTHTHK